MVPNGAGGSRSAGHRRRTRPPARRGRASKRVRVAANAELPKGDRDPSGGHMRTSANYAEGGGGCKIQQEREAARLGDTEETKNIFKREEDFALTELE